MHCDLNLWGHLSSRTQILCQSHWWNICLPILCAFLPGSLYLRPWAEVLFKSLPLRSPCGGQRGTSWTDFPHADSVPSTFPLLARPPCSPHCPSPRVQKPAKPFVWGSLNRGTTHPWTLNMHVIPWSKMEQEESSLPSFLDSCLYYCNEWLKTNSFIFNLVLSLPPAIHGSSLLSLPDGLSWCEHPSFSGWSSKH